VVAAEPGPDDAALVVDARIRGGVVDVKELLSRRQRDDRHAADVHHRALPQHSEKAAVRRHRRDVLERRETFPAANRLCRFRIDVDPFDTRASTIILLRHPVLSERHLLRFARE
jgi:hypothetical protein